MFKLKTLIYSKLKVCLVERNGIREMEMNQILLFGRWEKYEGGEFERIDRKLVV